MRKWSIAILAAVLAALALPIAAGADHSRTELVSIGSTGGNGAFTVFYRGASADGSRVFFETSERLVAADTDTRPDVYERAGGATTLVSTGSTGGNGGFDAFFAGASADGARVFFGSAEKLTAADTDGQTDLYQRAAGATTLLSTGAVGGNGPFGAFFDGASADGTRVFFHTAEQLASADLDTQTDVYERASGATALVSIGPGGGSGAFAAFFDGSSDDGARVFFSTGEQLEAGDTDAAFDVYQRSGGSTTRASAGSIGGNGASDAYFDSNSQDGSRVFLTTDEPLAAGDTDSSFDVYERSGGATTRLSTGAAGGNGANDALFRAASADGSRVFLETDEGLAAGDVDGQVDVYERSGGTTTRLSTGPAGGNGAFEASFAGSSDDGTHVFFETDEILTTGDLDAEVDVYERSGGTTLLVSSGPTGGNGALDATFAGSSADGGRVFFETLEQLAGGDGDALRDLYERQGASVTLVSRGPAGGNGAFNVDFAGLSADGTRALFTTSEKLVSADTDASADIYAATPAPYPVPAAASSLRVALVPSFRQTISASQCASRGGVNSTHGAPLSLGSCNPPGYIPGTRARQGPQSSGSAELTVVPGNLATPADEADVAIVAGATDVRDRQSGADYVPNAGGPDVVLVEKLRISDRRNSPSGSDPATVVDFDFPVGVDCAGTVDPIVGSACSASTSADAVTPGVIAEGRDMVLQVFRVRVNDSGQNGALGDADDRNFSQQGIYVP